MSKFVIEKSNGSPQRDTYPFKELKVGECFKVHDLTKERSLRTRASKNNKGKKRFTVTASEAAVTVTRVK